MTRYCIARICLDIRRNWLEKSSRIPVKTRLLCFLATLYGTLLAGCCVSAPCTAPRGTYGHHFVAKAAAPLENATSARGLGPRGASYETLVVDLGDHFPESFHNSLDSPGGRFFPLPTAPVFLHPTASEVVGEAFSTDVREQTPPAQADGPELIPTPAPLPQNQAAPSSPPPPDDTSSWQAPPTVPDWNPIAEGTLPPNRQPPQNDAWTATAGPSAHEVGSWLFAVPPSTWSAVQAQQEPKVILPNDESPQRKRTAARTTRVGR